MWKVQQVGLRHNKVIKLFQWADGCPSTTLAEIVRREAECVIRDVLLLESEISLMFEWLRDNAEISHDAPDLIVGCRGDKRFRGFKDEGFVGVISLDGNWNEARVFYCLEDLKGYLS